jgi:hypothetical protein
MTIAYPYTESVKSLCSVYAEDYRNTEAAWATLVEAICTG